MSLDLLVYISEAMDGLCTRHAGRHRCGNADNRSIGYQHYLIW